MSIADKLTYLAGTKTAIKDAIEAKGVTVGDIPFRQYATKIGDIGGGGSPDPYSRPADWLEMPTLTEGQQKVVGLHAVWPHDSNFCAFTVSGAYTVDWGGRFRSSELCFRRNGIPRFRIQRPWGRDRVYQGI